MNTMAVTINPNVKNEQQNYVREVANYFFNHALNPSKEIAFNDALNVYKGMVETLNKKVNSIATTYSRFKKFYEGFPIFTFKSSGGSMWYFAYVKDENDNIAVLDMQNINQNQGRTFIHDEVQKSLDFMQRLLEIKI